MTGGLLRTGLKFGVFVTVALLLLVVLVDTMTNGVPGPTRSFRAEFTDVSGLRVGDDVRVAGVRVGRVDSIDVTTEGAEVRFDLERSQPLLSTTRMVMRYQNLLGQRYLELVQPPLDRDGTHGQPLGSGATVPLSRTDPGFDLTELLNGFRPLFDVLQPQDVNQLAASIVQVLQGQGGTLESLLQQTGRLTSYVADRDAVIGAVLTNLTPVLQTLQRRGPQLASTVVELRRLMAGLAKDRTAIGNAVDGVGRLVGTTSSLLHDARGPLVSATHRFVSVAAVLARTRRRLARAIDSFGGSVGALGRITSYQNAMNVFLCSMSFVIGGTAIDPANGSTRHSAVCR